jgi:hypothetical protein
MSSSSTLGVVWQRGTVKIDITPTDNIPSVISRLAERIRVDPNQITLYRDWKHEDRLPNLPIASLSLDPHSLIYMKVIGPLPEQSATPDSKVSVWDYLGPSEKEPTAEMKRMHAEFGPNSVSLAFFSHRDSLKPHLDRQPDSSCYAVRLGEEAIERFLAVAQQSEFSMHRIAFLFGRVNVRTGKVTVHVAVEPPQRNFPDHFELEESFSLSPAVAIASEFPMQCCGMLVSHSTDPKYPIPSYLAQLAAHYQNTYGEYFTILIATPSGDSGVGIEGFQVSDEMMRLHREDWFLPPSNPRELEFRDEIFVCGCRRRSADVNLSLCAVRVRRRHSKFPNHAFPAPSQNPTLLDLEMHLRETEFYPNWYQFFDFNLLLFLERADICNLGEVRAMVPVLLQQEDLPDELMEKVERCIERGHAQAEG